MFKCNRMRGLNLEVKMPSEQDMRNSYEKIKKQVDADMHISKLNQKIYSLEKEIEQLLRIVENLSKPLEDRIEVVNAEVN